MTPQELQAAVDTATGVITDLRDGATSYPEEVDDHILALKALSNGNLERLLLAAQAALTHEAHEEGECGCNWTGRMQATLAAVLGEQP